MLVRVCNLWWISRTREYRLREVELCGRECGNEEMNDLLRDVKSSVV